MAATMNLMGRPKKAEQTEQIRLPKSVVKRIRRVAVHLEMDPGDFIAEYFGPALDRAEAKMLKEIGEEREADAEGE